MANMCMNEIVVISKEKAALDMILADFKKARESGNSICFLWDVLRAEFNCHDSGWFADSLDALEIEYSNKTECYELRFFIESKWIPAEGFVDLILHHYPVKVFYYAEECGCSIYKTNDKEGLFFPARYVVDDEIAGEQEYFDNLDSVNNYLSAYEFTITDSNFEDKCFSFEDTLTIKASVKKGIYVVEKIYDKFKNGNCIHRFSSINIANSYLRIFDMELKPENTEISKRIEEEYIISVHSVDVV